ncbi:MAG TPA: Clp protease N-terminal domain-containing protein [Gemmataceae bacterium]|nr:Clp protease N-terminal domain-containing protein [Gemmataceae bacterium]
MRKVPLILRLSYRLYSLLLIVYPKAFRREYGEPMLQSFRDCCANTYSMAGYLGLACLWWRTLEDLVATSLKEHLSRDRVRPSIPSGLALPVTPRARRGLEIALWEATVAGRAEVSAEDVVLGLIGEGSGTRIGKETGVAGCVLRGLSISMSRARQAGALHQTPSSQPQRSANDFLTILMRRAEVEARRLGHPFVGTEHFLLSLLADHQPTLAPLFDCFAVSMERVQYDTLRMIER